MSRSLAPAVETYPMFDYVRFKAVKTYINCTVLVAVISHKGDDYGRPLYTFTDAVGDLQ